MKQKRKSPKNTVRQAASDLLHKHAEEVLLMFEDGASYDDICVKIGVHRAYLSEFVCTSEYSARIRESQKRSAQKYAELALTSLKEIRTGDDKADIIRQRELAHHYRWLAKVKSPKEFNENRVDTDELAAKLLAPTIILKKE